MERKRIYGSLLAVGLLSGAACDKIPAGWPGSTASTPTPSASPAAIREGALVSPSVSPTVRPSVSPSASPSQKVDAQGNPCPTGTTPGGKGCETALAIPTFAPGERLTQASCPETPNLGAVIGSA